MPPVDGGDVDVGQPHVLRGQGLPLGEEVGLRGVDPEVVGAAAAAPDPGPGDVPERPRVIEVRTGDRRSGLRREPRVEHALEQRERVVRVPGQIPVDGGEGGTGRGDDLVDPVAELVEQVVDEQGGAAVDRVVPMVVGRGVDEVLASAVQPEVGDRVIGVDTQAQEAVHRQELAAEEPGQPLSLAALVPTLEPPPALRHHEDLGDLRDEQIAQVRRVATVARPLRVELDRRTRRRSVPTGAVALRGHLDRHPGDREAAAKPSRHQSVIGLAGGDNGIGACRFRPSGTAQRGVVREPVVSRHATVGQPGRHEGHSDPDPKDNSVEPSDDDDRTVSVRGEKSRRSNARQPPSPARHRATAS